MDIWRLWSKKTGVAVRFVMAPFSDTLQMVGSGRADIHGGCFLSAQRAEYLDYVSPLLRTTTNLFFHRDIYGIESLQDLPPYRIGVIQGDYSVEWLRQRLPDASLVTFRNNHDMFTAAKQGRIRVLVSDAPVGIYFLNKFGLSSQFKHYSDQPLFGGLYQAAVAKGNKVLPPIIERGLEQISREERHAIRNRWLGSQATGRMKVLSIACDRDFAPFTWLTPSGRPAGILIDIWRLWATKTGAQIEFVFGDWAETLGYLKNNQVDVHAGLFETEELDRWLDYSLSLLPVEVDLFYPTSKGPPPLDSLAGRKVGIVGGASHASWLPGAFPGAEFVAYKNLNALLKGLTRGELDAAVEVGVFMRFALAAQGLSGAVEKSAKALKINHILAGIPKGQKDILSLVNKGLGEIDQQDIIRIEKRWITDPELRSYEKLKHAFRLNESQMAWLAKHRQIRLGIDPAWMPFEEISEDGVYEGISSSYVSLLNSMLKVNMRPVPGLTWQEVIQGARNGEIDVIPCLHPTEKRAEFLAYTRPYISSPNVIAARTDTRHLTGLRDLEGSTVAVVQDYAVQESLQKGYPKITLLPVANIQEGFEAVLSGRALAYVDNEATVKYHIRKLGIEDLRIAASTTLVNNLVMGVRKDWPEMVTILDAALSSLPDEQRAKLENHWLNIRFQERIDWDFVLQAGAASAVVVGVILAVILIWNRRLAREVVQRKEAEAAVRRSQEQFRIIADYTFGWEGWHDAQGRLLWVNPAVERITGYSVEECLGMDDYPLPLIHPQYHDVLRKIVSLAVQGREGEDFLLRVVPKGGGEVWAAVSWNPVFDAQGKFTGFRTSVRDVTERRLADAEVRKLSTAVEQSPASVVITGLDGTIEYVNPTFTRVTGYTLEEAVGKNPRLLKSGKHPPEFYREMWSTIVRGQTWRGELINRKKSGELYWESVSISPVLDESGKVAHFLAVKQDISDRKRAEAELMEAKARAEEATQAKSRFLANMSHEIRTPMNAILGMTHLALKTDLDAKQRDYLDKIQFSAQALLGIINDILDVSKIEADKLELETIDFSLDEVLKSLSNLLSLKAQEKGLELLFDIDPALPRRLRGDPLRLGQVLINLGNNAVKFTDQGEIVIAVRLVESRGDTIRARFSVRDTGIGMTPDQQSRLFQAFSQVDTSTTRKYGGTGLGLTICQRLVEMMHGEIQVESATGAGTEFMFTAEFGVDQHQAHKPHHPAPDLQGMRVLVVDDNATSREILQGMLESLSFVVETAASGTEALEKLASAGTASYDLVLMDWVMPGMDGLAATEKIKKHPGLAKPPTIIMVTAYGREDVMKRAEPLGLDGFLIKPVSPSLLLDAIMSALGRQGPGEAKSGRPPAAGPQSDSRLSGARVLLVEDNEINQQVARELLEGAGIAVTIATDGGQAVQAVKSGDFDAVLMDIQMPVLDGYAATRAIRRDAHSEHLPIIAMTANAMAGDREKALDAGMNDHLPKPIDVNRLFATLNKWIELRPGVRLPQEGAPPPEAEGSDDSALPRALPGVDMAQGLVRVGGNQELYRKLLIRLRDDHARAGEEIDGLLERGRNEEAARLAHSVKGVAGNLGATELQAAAADLESAINQSDTGGMPALRERFRGLLAELVSALAPLGVDQAAAQTTVREGDAATPSELAAVLEDMLPHLRARKPLPSGAVLDRLKAMNWPPEHNLEFVDLSKLINKYKFKEALALAERLLDKLKG